MKDSPRVLQTILNNRRNFIELIAATVLIGFGISLAASSLLEYCEFANKTQILLWSGCTLCIVGAGYFVLRFFGAKRFLRTMDGFFILDFPKKEVVSIDTHDYSCNLHRILDHAFFEDKALVKTWNKINFQDRDKSFGDFLKIMTESSEYYLLEKLSTHLTDFFNDRFSKKEFMTYERNDLADIFLKNRFLELFSKPMEQREAFIASEEDVKANGVECIDTEGNETVVMSFFNGAMYNRFNLNLPKNSRIRRNKDNSISIETDRFTLKLKTVVSGVNTYIPWEFCKVYLGLDMQEYSAFITTYEIEISFKFGSLFRTIGWQYYHWVDSFMTRLEQGFEKDYYFDHEIEWTKAYTILKPLIKKKK